MSRIASLLVAIALAAVPVQAQTVSRAAAPALGEFSNSLKELARKVSPCVVEIFVTGYAPPEDQQGAAGDPAVENSSGSGVILDPDGYIVTNAHVVENATKLQVQLRRGRIVPGHLVAIDHDTDLAVIKVDVTGLPALPIADSDDLEPGQVVLAFGSPFGLDSTVTMGVVSAVARQLDADDPMIYIQTDAPINPGNSGGALVDTEGRLVGVNTLIYTQGGGSEGLGFAAPSNIVRNVFQQIRRDGRVRRGQIGVTPQTITPVLAEALGLPEQDGVILADVDADSPAAKAGLLPGDVVLALNGKRMANARHLRVSIFTRPIGEQVTLEIARGTQHRTVSLAIAESDDDQAELERVKAPRARIAALGLTVVDLTSDVKEALGDLRSSTGAAVVAVALDAPYSAEGRLEPGDVIHQVNGRPIADVAALQRAVASVSDGAAIALQVERDGDLAYVAFRASRR